MSSSSSSSRPLDITNSRPTRDDIVPSSVQGTPGSPGPAFRFGTPSGRAGTPRLGAQVTPPIANIPPRLAGDTSPGSFSARSLRPRTPHTNGSSTPTGVAPGESPASGRLDLEDVSEEEMARVLRRHLVPRRGADNINNTEDIQVSESRRGSHSNSNTPRQGTQRDVFDEPFPIPFDAPGGDITHPIYKWQADRERQAGRQRAASFHASSSDPSHPPQPALDHIREPGGFRRNYVLRRANEQGFEDPAVSNNFIEFLYLFGHFAGEDLEEDEEEGEAVLQPIERLSTAGPAGYGAAADATKISETAPLLGSGTISGRSLSRAKRAARRSIGPDAHGDTTVTQAIFMLLKSFVGTGVLFLGKAFYNGGILFSSISMIAIAFISLYSFLLLVKVKDVVPGSYGDIGGVLYGPWMRYAILSAITLSQLGFVCAYTIFVSENLQAFVLAVTKCTWLIPVQYFILIQLIIFLPLALIRNIAKLSSTALVADVFILAGLVYIFGSEIAIISDRGIADVELFNLKDFPLLIGTAVFSFEGVGLVIPISDSMREPRKFPSVLTGVMLFLIVLFGGGGVLAYLAFGSDVQSVVITNLDSKSKLVQAVQFLYSLAILLSVPLQLFPAVRIMENGLFSHSGKGDPWVKWRKNILRFIVVVVCAIVSWAGASELDKFVALVGSFACVPLCYVFPAMLHYRACARSHREKFVDILLMVFGFVAATYTTAQTIALMAAPAGGSPAFGRCEGPSPRA